MERIDRQTAFSGVKPPGQALAIDVAKLEAWLGVHLPGFAGPLRVDQFKGGQSNPTYRLETPGRLYVLRRKPPGPLLAAAHAVDREYKVMRALFAKGFPVPEPLAHGRDDSVVGTEFFVMALVEGRVFWDPAMPGSTPGERAAVHAAMIETLADLHAFDPAALGLSDFGRAEGYVARQIRRWSEAYRLSRTQPIAVMDRLMAWLPDHVPPRGRAAVVHGDFRLDNLMIAPDAPRVAAVLDWELATIGDPIADLVYHLMTWAMPPAESGAGAGSLLGLDLAALGLPSLEEQALAYARRAGLGDIPHLDIYLTYNLFRMAAIMQGIAGRVRDGTATSDQAALMGTQVEPLALAAWHYAQRAGAR